MMSKAEDSKALNRERFLRDLMWERQKKEAEAARIASEMRRRRLLAEENRAKNQKKVTRRRANIPCHEILVLFVLSRLIFWTCMRSHPVGLNVWFLVGPFVYFHPSCVWTAKALARLSGCAGRLCDEYHNLMSLLKVCFNCLKLSVLQ